MTRSRTRVFAHSIALAALVAALLSGCVVGGARPPKSQLDAWAAAIETVPHVVSATAETGSDSEGFGYYIEAFVTIDDDTFLTYGIMKGVYDALVASTSGKWRGKTIRVDFGNANDPYSGLSVKEAFTKAGVSCQGWSACWGADETYLEVSVSGDGKGFPPATTTPSDAPRLPEVTTAQLGVWTDAMKASDPSVTRADASAYGSANDEGGGFVYIDVTLGSGEALTFDIMQNLFDALVASTPDQWRGENLSLTFHPADAPKDTLSVQGAFSQAGVADPSTGAVSTTENFLNIKPDPALGGFPSAAGSDGTPAPHASGS